MSKRILVVEDQEDSRRILRDLLKSADYEIMEAVNGEEALTAATTVARLRPNCGGSGARQLPYGGRVPSYIPAPWAAAND
jgi:CheY-like chemotaxis protein